MNVSKMLNLKNVIIYYHGQKVVGGVVSHY